MTIRFATLADIPAMHVVRMGVRENVLVTPGLVTHDSYRAILEDEARGPGWVAEMDGRIVGFSVADLRERNLWALFLNPDFEKRGLGRQLLARAVAWLFACGAPEIWLTTAPGSRAEHFYRAAGWTARGADRHGDIRFTMLPPA